MTLATYLLYVAAVALLIVTPGPTTLMCITTTANHGPGRAMLSVGGSLLACLCVMALSALGMGALLAASEAAFTALKVIGACYLVWLGIKTFRSPLAMFEVQADARAGRSFFIHGFLVGASNPKALLFFAAFFPQFIDPASPMLPQFALLAATFLAGDAMVMSGWAFGVGRLLSILRQGSVGRWINRVCGGLFAVMGVLLLLTRRHS